MLNERFCPFRPGLPLAFLPLALLAVALLTACASVAPDGEKAAAGPDVPAAGRTVTLLAINDVYRIEGLDGGVEGGLARVRQLRADLEREAPDLLLLHAGDAIFPSLMSRQYDGAHMIDVLNRLDGDAEAFDERMFFTIGNHEFDKGGMEDAAGVVQKRLDESQFTWFDTNLTWAEGPDGRPAVASPHLLRSKIVTSGGVRVGLFGLVTDFKQPDYVTSFGDLEAAARQVIADLRAQGAELVVGLTHLTLAEDEEVLAALGEDGPDLVIGGHEHNKLEAEVGGRLVLKADADAKTATVVRVHLRDGERPTVRYEWAELDASVPKDPHVDARVAYWEERLDVEYCAGLGKERGCLEEVVGSTRVVLTGEELAIRRYETNYGNWIVDQALQGAAASTKAASTKAASTKAMVAFVNSGSLRLNQNIPVGDVELAFIEETFQYSTELEVLRITGAVLQEALSHSVTDWTGSGHFLQVSGFAFRHDPQAVKADRLTLLAPSGPRPIRPDEEIIAVVPSYIAGGGDGYAMLENAERVPADGLGTLRDLVVAAFQAAGANGIAPAVEGRICNTEEEGPCLAVAP